MVPIKYPLLRPYMNENIKARVMEVLGSGQLAQGPKVDEFEQTFSEMFGVKYPVAVNSGTSALELAYDLAGIKEGDTVWVPVLTCTATNIPLLRRKVNLKFMDVNPETLNPVLPSNLKPTDFVVSVDLNGIKNDIKADVNDSAQALGANHEVGTTCYSFQAIKLFTTGDGGMVAPATKEQYRQARLLRWFGIDRDDPQRSQDYLPYKNRPMMSDIEVLGYKYHMNDIQAAMGLGGLAVYDKLLNHRRELFTCFRHELSNVPGLKILEGPEMYHYSLGLLVEDRDSFATMLASHGVESNLIQLRNDIYKVFGGLRQDLPNMNALEEKYIFLPLNNKLGLLDAYQICGFIKGGW